MRSKTAYRRDVRIERYRVWFLVAALAVAGCAVRSVAPVAMNQTGDEQLGCAQLYEELAANDNAAQNFLREDKNVESANVAKNVAGLVVPMGFLIFATTDLSNAEQVKARALIDRNERLNFLIRSKGCSRE